MPSPGTRGTVELLDGEAWIEVHEVDPLVPQWTPRVLSLGPSSGPEVQLRFCFESFETLDPYSGWSIDAIELLCVNCVP